MVANRKAMLAAIQLMAAAAVAPAAWAADPDTLVVPDAGEVLYRLR